MSTELEYATEGLSFEERRLEARNALDTLQDTIANILEERLYQREEGAKEIEYRLSTQHVHVQGEAFEFAESVDELMQMFVDWLIQKEWEKAIHVIHQLYGIDALEAALKDQINALS